MTHRARMLAAWNVLAAPRNTRTKRKKEKNIVGFVFFREFSVCAWTENSVQTASQT